MRALIYSRVSTDDQAENFSLPSQLSACRQYASDHGMSVIEELTDEYSGMKLDRPGLDSLRKMARNREIDAVIVYSSDRWTRKLAHGLILREEMLKFGVELHTVNRGKSEDTPESRMTENIEGVFNEYWREKILESCKRGRRQKASEGKWPGTAHPPYGYRRDGQGRESSMTIDEREATIVRRIFSLYIGAYGKPMGAGPIAKVLTAERVPPPNRGVHGNGTWYKQSISRILKHEVYLGIFVFCGETVHFPHLALVDLATWEAAKKRKAQNRAVAGQYPRKYHYLLSGRIGCSCKGNMSGSSSGPSHTTYYECTSLRTVPEPTCRERARSEVADSLVWTWLHGLLADEEKLNKGLAAYLNRKENQLAPRRERLAMVDGLISKGEAKVARLAAEFADAENKIVGDALRAQMKLAGNDLNALGAERETLRAEIGQGELSQVDIGEIQRIAERIRRKLDNPTFEKARTLVNLLDLQAKLEYQDNVKGLRVVCRLNLDDENKGEWLSMDISKKEPCFKTGLQHPNKVIVFSTWLALPKKRASLAGGLFSFPNSNAIVKN